MAAPWLLDLSPDSLNLELTAGDLMADLDPEWFAQALADGDEAVQA